MKFSFLLIGLFILPALHAQSANPEVLHLKASLDSVTEKRPFEYGAYMKASDKARLATYDLISSDALRTAEDFYLASKMAGDPSGFYESRRVEHELALVALVLGHPDAVKRVAQSWDGLNWSFGRGQRIGSYKRDGVPVDMDEVPAANTVRSFFEDPAAARARAAKATNNAELERLRTEDQTDREPPMDQEKQARMSKNDPARRARVLELITAGAPATGRDFHNAALVLQHGHSVDDFRLAHELSMVAVALGDTSAVWLISRTYDRMLLRLGHRQRLNTQYGGAESKLLPLDTTAVNDRIRRALGSAPVTASAN